MVGATCALESQTRVLGAGGRSRRKAEENLSAFLRVKECSDGLDVMSQGRERDACSRPRRFDFGLNWGVADPAQRANAQTISRGSAYGSRRCYAIEEQACICNRARHQADRLQIGGQQREAVAARNSSDRWLQADAAYITPRPPLRTSGFGPPSPRPHTRLYPRC